MAPFKNREFKFLIEFVTCKQAIAESLIDCKRKKLIHGKLIPTLFRTVDRLGEFETKNMTYCNQLLKSFVQSLHKHFEHLLALDDSVSDCVMASVTRPYFRTNFA